MRTSGAGPVIARRAAKRIWLGHGRKLSALLTDADSIMPRAASQSARLSLTCSTGDSGEIWTECSAHHDLAMGAQMNVAMRLQRNDLALQLLTRQMQYRGAGHRRGSRRERNGARAKSSAIRQRTAARAARGMDMRYHARMDREILDRHQRQAEEHVAQGERHIARQRELVAELDRDGHDTTIAREFLAQLEQLQRLHIADRDRARAELGE